MTEYEALVACRDLWLLMAEKIYTLGPDGSIHEFKDKLLIQLGYQHMNFGCPLCEYQQAIDDCPNLCLLFNFWKKHWDHTKVHKSTRMCEQHGSPFKVVKDYMYIFVKYYKGDFVTRSQAVEACKQISDECDRIIKEYDNDED